MRRSWVDQGAVNNLDNLDAPFDMLVGLRILGAGHTRAGNSRQRSEPEPVSRGTRARASIQVEPCDHFHSAAKTKKRARSVAGSAILERKI